MTISLGLINLLEQLTELGVTLVYLFIKKEYNSERARQKRCIG